MNSSYQFLSAIVGGLLIGLPIVPQIAVAQQRSPSQANPCPSVYYEEPNNSRVVVPKGCSPNAFTQRLINLGRLPAANYPVTNMGVGGEAPTTVVQSQVLNPCPRIYYEEPYNSRNVVPQGCPPNALTEKLQTQGTATPSVGGMGAQPESIPSTPATRPIQPPLPEQRSQPIATVMPMNGQVSVRLKNNTNAEINYEVIGHTERRVLAGGEEVVLQNLPLPSTITAVRADNGFIKFMPVSTQTGMLEFSLDEEAVIDDNQGVIRIQEDGQVFLN